MSNGILNFVQLNMKHLLYTVSDFNWPFLGPYMGVIPNPKIAFIFPIFMYFSTYFPNFNKIFSKKWRKR